jgi:hypothetical protein
MFEYEEAKRLEGEAFRIAVSDGPALDVVLVMVKALERGNRPAQFRDPYKLHFKGTKGIRGPQTTYRLTHATQGSWEVFLVPVAHDAETDEYTYEAVFN